MAATAPGNEKGGKVGKIFIQRRLLSYYLIKHDLFGCRKVFKQIKK